ncbi:hypothetical protein FA15DRAFT_665497 [Coprinopsis marcescibilis]|uniref:MPN domain-containing protein n=1 Tax=Coprinopsis marcescibilis TaxID=230819 RepID=A0A5C3L6H8_COPMA|nr:hypothetical protein FA15DRAFT_665497 [Coprinopsis marcescibilis]
MSATQPADGQAHHRRTRRPASIAELAEKALDTTWDERRELKHYLRIAEKYSKEGKELAKQGDLETAFILLAKAATLVLEKLPTHRNYQKQLNQSQRNNLSLNGQDILDQLSALKPVLVDRFDKWLKAHPDGVDNDKTPEAKNVHLPQDDPRVQALANATRLQEEDKIRARHREQQRRAAEEAALWRQQREESSRRDAEAKERKRDVAVAAARRAANPNPNGYGSQHTVVMVEPGASNYPQEPGTSLHSGASLHSREPGASLHQQQQDEFKRREEEIMNRRLEQKRKEQDDIAARQYAADDAVRALRQDMGSLSLGSAGASQPYVPNIATPTSARYHQPYTPTTHSSFASPTPHTPISYPSLEGPVIMPLENPLGYEGDSTDSESVQRHHEFHRRATRSPRQHNNRAPVPMASVVPPITTTSPPPQQQRIDYPRLMSPHQQRQGYYPSLNSMFTPEHNAQMSSSLLFDSRATNEMYPPNLLPSTSTQAYYNPPHPSRTSVPVPPPPPPTQYPGYPGPSRPAPPVPPPQVTPTAGPNRVSRAGQSDDKPSLKQVTFPRETLSRFLTIAKVNTVNNRETCGLLLGKDKGHKFVVTTLLIPKQHSTSDTCTMDEEELVLEFTEERNLITLGWIHTHPSQSCFMSSVDLHTHSGFQRMLPESFAVVCAPTSNPNFGIFRLTDPPGLSAVLECTAKEAFHPHPDLPIYTDADKGHVQMKEGPLEIVDLR